jgi:hypothetical protein
LQKMTLSKEKEAVAATLSTVSQRAMEIVALPADQREARYKIYRQVYIESAMEHGLPCPKAHAWADQMNQWIRTLVKKIEQSGGAAGGTA